MASPFDESDFIDSDYQSAKTPRSPGPGQMNMAGHLFQKPPNREELDHKVGETQYRLAELKRAQEQLERERAALEEARRRRIELQTGREETLENLTRGISLLQEAEFAARRDAEQMAKTLEGLNAALGQVQSIREETWTQENWSVELTRALTAIENARMEWNGARLKWTLLNGETAAAPGAGAGLAGVSAKGAPVSLLQLGQAQSFWQLCRIGLALTWPIVLVGAGLVVMIGFWLFR